MINYYQEFLKENKKKEVVRKLNLIKKFKNLRCFEKLRDNQSELKEEDLQKKKALLKIFSRFRDDKENNFKRLRNNMVENRQKRESAVKLIRKNMVQEKYFFFRLLKINKFLKERNKLNSVLTSMIICLRKNHRVVMRKALNKWARTELKEKVKKMDKTLTNLIRKRKFDGYEKVKKNYLYAKFEKSVQGLLSVMNLMENKKYEKKKEFMKIMVDKFVDRNPWFKKVINIWAIQSKPNDQIAFWKMRYSKNLKKEGLSAEQSLRLKKLFYLFSREVQRNFSHSFWRINAFADSKDTQRNFRSLIPKY